MGFLSRITGRDTIADLSARLAEAEGYAKRQARLMEALPGTITRQVEEKLKATGAWENLSGVTGDWAEDITKARKAYRGEYRDNAGLRRLFGMSCRVVNMHSEYCFGGGLECPAVADEALAQHLADWWWYQPNQEAAFSMPSQRRLSASMLVDGSLYLALFAATRTRPLGVRVMDPLEFSGVVTHPDDKSKILYHVRKHRPGKLDRNTGRMVYDAPEQVTYYPDVDSLDPRSMREFPDPYAADADGLGGLPVAKEQESGQPIAILRVCMGDLAASDRGQGIMRPMMDWELRILRMAEDQAIISAATAALMNEITVKGGASAVAAVTSHFGQDTASPTTYPSNTGDFNVHNEAVKMDISRAPTGAYEARQNWRMMAMPMVAIGGVALHYIGDPENANLATASSMEGPILKHFLGYQGLWGYVNRRLAQEALVPWTGREEQVDITVPMPELVVEDMLDNMQAIALMQDKGWATDEQAAREAWSARGAADVEAEVATAMEGATQQAPAPAQTPEEALSAMGGAVA